MSIPNRPLDYEPPRRHDDRRTPATAGERARSFLLGLFLTPFSLGAAVAGVFLLGVSIGWAMILLVVATLVGFALVRASADAHRRGPLLAGSLTGVGVVALLVGGCFMWLSNLKL